ncbi:MAG: hypothetical protein GY874_03040 [Desulfobacteraceae bacterium]|nr:hypothetical protein [Desulfobacteraceae bacterium]
MKSVNWFVLIFVVLTLFFAGCNWSKGEDPSYLTQNIPSEKYLLKNTADNYTDEYPESWQAPQIESITFMCLEKITDRAGGEPYWEYIELDYDESAVNKDLYIKISFDRQGSYPNELNFEYYLDDDVSNWVQLGTIPIDQAACCFPEYEFIETQDAIHLESAGTYQFTFYAVDEYGNESGDYYIELTVFGDGRFGNIVVIHISDETVVSADDSEYVNQASQLSDDQGLYAYFNIADGEAISQDIDVIQDYCSSNEFDDAALAEPFTSAFAEIHLLTDVNSVNISLQGYKIEYIPAGTFQRYGDFATPPDLENRTGEYSIPVKLPSDSNLIITLKCISVFTKNEYVNKIESDSNFELFDIASYTVKITLYLVDEYGVEKEAVMERNVFFSNFKNC